MARRTGTADLPLHYGQVPKWLSQRMERLAGVVVEAIVLHYGRAELLRRLAHPFWFQSFGALMGQDWHSSGITTSTVWALKRALADRQWKVGVHVCGGRGSHSRNTPQELRGIGDAPGSTANASAKSVDWWPRSTARRYRTASLFTCTLSSSPTTAPGRSSSKG